MTEPARTALIDVPTRTARIGVDVGGTFTDLVLHDPAATLCTPASC